MSDLHDRFGAWLTDGARADLPRDAALHAASCDACRRDAAAFDALLASDPGAASLPPVVAGRRPRAVLPPSRIIRTAAAVAAVLLLAVWVGIGAGSLLDGGRSGAGSTLASPTPLGEGILGNAGGPRATGSADPRASSSARPTESAVPSAKLPSIPTAATPQPVFSSFRPVVTPGPTAITPPIGTAGPSATSAATPAPTALPSLPPSPTPLATPAPTPTQVPTPPPTPDDCADGLDNDGDFLIDILDPGCLLTGDEASA